MSQSCKDTYYYQKIREIKFDCLVLAEVVTSDYVNLTNLQGQISVLKVHTIQPGASLGLFLAGQGRKTEEFWNIKYIQNTQVFFR